MQYKKEVSMTVEELKEICLDYDKKYGELPGSEYEGLAILNHFLEKLGLPWVSVPDYKSELNRP
jgi:hypothetical protein